MPREVARDFKLIHWFLLATMGKPGRLLNITRHTSRVYSTRSTKISKDAYLSLSTSKSPRHGENRQFFHGMLKVAGNHILAAKQAAHKGR